MKKLFLCLIFILGLAVQVQAQSTTVSGTITDAGAQSWNSGTYQFTFVPNQAYQPEPQYTWTGGALTQNFTGTLSGTGTYSVSIPSNSAISPAGSTWAVTFCPLANSTCYFAGNITITGGTQTISPAPPTISISLTGTSSPSTRVYSTSEVAAAPLGAQIFLIGTGTQTCTAVTGNVCNTWTSASGGGSTGSPFSNSIILSTNCGTAPNCYQVFADTKYISDATFTNGSNAFTCPNSDCNFVAGVDNGKICWGTNATTDVSTLTSVVALPEGTLTVTGAQAGTCSGGNVTNAGAAASNFLVWGHLDTPANGSATTDQVAAASLAAANACTPLIFPTGVLQLEQAEFNVGPVKGFCNQNSAVNTRKGFSFVGQGPTATVFLITPKFTASSNTGGTGCNGPNAGGVGCFLTLNNLVAQNFEMTCLGNSAMGATFNGKSLITISGVPINGGSNFSLNGVYLIGCGANTTGLKGVNVGNGVTGAISGGQITSGIIEAFGNKELVDDPGTSTVMLQSIGNQLVGCGAAGECVDVRAGIFNSHADFIGYTNSTTNNVVLCEAGVTCWFHGATFPYQTGVGVADIGILGGANVVLENTNINNPTAGGFVIGFSASTTLSANNSSIIAATAADAMSCNTGTCTYWDTGGNTVSGITGIGTLNWLQEGSITGTAAVATNITANTAWGTSGA